MHVGQPQAGRKRLQCRALRSVAHEEQREGRALVLERLGGGEQLGDSLARNHLACVKHDRSRRQAEGGVGPSCEGALVHAVLDFQDPPSRDAKGPEVLRGGASVADPARRPARDQPPEPLTRDADVRLGIHGAAPPDPDWLSADGPVQERDQGPESHLGADDGVRPPAQKVKQVSRCQVKVAHADRRALHPLPVLQRESPRSPDASELELLVDSCPFGSIAFPSREEHRHVEMARQVVEDGNPVRRHHVRQDGDPRLRSRHAHCPGRHARALPRGPPCGIARRLASGSGSLR